MEIKRAAAAKPRSFLQSECTVGQVYRLVETKPNYHGESPSYLICARISAGYVEHLRMISISSGNRQSDAENPLERYVPVNAVLHVED